MERNKHTYTLQPVAPPGHICIHLVLADCIQRSYNQVLPAYTSILNISSRYIQVLMTVTNIDVCICENERKKKKK